MPGELRGWQPDPYGIHELRYFTANGKPSRLVRDGGGWSRDEPPKDILSRSSHLATALAERTQHFPAGMADQSGFSHTGPGVWSNPTEERIARIRERITGIKDSPPQPTPPPSDRWETTVAHPADWYQDPSDPGQLRYWDGVAWTQQIHRASLSPLGSVAPLIVAPTDLGMTLTDATAKPTTSLPMPQEQWGKQTAGVASKGPTPRIYKQWWAWATAAVVLLIVVAVAVAIGGSKNNPDTLATTTTSAASRDPSTTATTSTTTPIPTTTSAPPTAAAVGRQVAAPPHVARPSPPTTVRSSPATTNFTTTPTTTTTTVTTGVTTTTIVLLPPPTSTEPGSTIPTTTSSPSSTTTTSSATSTTSTATTAPQLTTSTTVAPTTTTTTTATSLTSYLASGSSPDLRGLWLGIFSVLFGGMLLLVIGLIRRRHSARRRQRRT